MDNSGVIGEAWFLFILNNLNIFKRVKKVAYNNDTFRAIHHPQPLPSYRDSLCWFLRSAKLQQHLR